MNSTAKILHLSEVYKLTIEKAMYSGSILGVLSAYAEVSKFQSIDMSISTMGTLLAVICEAEGYTLGYIIADNWARKKNVSKVSIWCFITAFLSTFCQGSRGGVFMIIVAIFQIAKKFISPQSAPGGWAGPIVCLIVGGALLAGGWTFVSNIAQGGKKTIEDLGSTIVPLIQNRFF